MNKEGPPEPLDFFIWTVEDVGLWLEEINLGSYRQVFKEIGVNGEYLESLSMFTTEQILRFIRRCHMKWGDFITLCKELRRIKVACLKGEQEVRRPWWAPPCLSVVFVKVAKRNRQSRVVSLKLEAWCRALLSYYACMYVCMHFPFICIPFENVLWYDKLSGSIFLLSCYIIVALVLMNYAEMIPAANSVRKCYQHNWFGRNAS